MLQDVAIIENFVPSEISVYLNPAAPKPLFLTVQLPSYW